MAHEVVCVDEFVSGERLQSLADVSIIPIGSGIGESECDFVQAQQKNNNYNTYFYNEQTELIPDFVQNAKTIFVNNWTLDKFFRIIFPKLKNYYTFISHNSDQCFDERYSHYLNDCKVVKWYSQNATATHDKLFGLPIGIANQQYSHGDLNLLKTIVEENIQKSILVNKNFDIYTNHAIRSFIDNITAHNGIVMQNKKNQKDYLIDLAQSLFCISPPGNGPDCHRVWECLYLNTIPVVKSDPCFKYFTNLPILFIESWECVTIPFLRENVSRFLDKSVSIDELKMSFWKNTILPKL
jgi:hypothetical protein